MMGTADVRTMMRVEHQPPQSLVAVCVNGADCGLLNVPAEQAAEFIGVLNGAVDAMEAIRLVPSERLMDLANWFELEQEERPGWTRGKAVQEDLRRMAQLSLNALAKAKGGTG